VFQTFKTNFSLDTPSEFHISLTAILTTLPLLSHSSMDSTSLTMSYSPSDGVFKIVLTKDLASCSVAISASGAVEVRIGRGANRRPAKAGAKATAVANDRVRA